MAFDTNNLYVGDLKEISVNPKSKNTACQINGVLLYKVGDGVFVDFSRSEINEEDMTNVIKHYKDDSAELKASYDNFLVYEYGKGPGSFQIENLRKLNIKSIFVGFSKLIDIYEKFSSTPLDEEIDIM